MSIELHFNLSWLVFAAVFVILAVVDFHLGQRSPSLFSSSCKILSFLDQFRSLISIRRRSNFFRLSARCQLLLFFRLCKLPLSISLSPQLPFSSAELLFAFCVSFVFPSFTFCTTEIVQAKSTKLEAQLRRLSCGLRFPNCCRALDACMMLHLSLASYIIVQSSLIPSTAQATLDTVYF